MKLKPVGSNMTELHVGDAVILFSYQTPVAAQVGNRFYRTTTKYSSTTSSHIRKWLGMRGAGEAAETVAQEFITHLTCEV
jgi:hypothetical protein